MMWDPDLEVIGAGGKTFHHKVQEPRQTDAHGTADPTQRDTLAQQVFNHGALLAPNATVFGRDHKLALAHFTQDHHKTAPELFYLEAKFATLMSYGVTVDVLGELLPIGAQLNATTVQRHLLRVAERVEQELGEEQVMFVEGCPAEWEDLPAPDAPLIVGLDGGYVHARDELSRKAGWLEVIAGESIPAEGAAKCFGFVHTYDPKPKRRLFEVLKSQGMQANQQVTFLSDGGDTVRELQVKPQQIMAHK